MERAKHIAACDNALPAAGNLTDKTVLHTYVVRSKRCTPDYTLLYVLWTQCGTLIYRYFRKVHTKCTAFLVKIRCGCTQYRDMYWYHLQPKKRGRRLPLRVGCTYTSILRKDAGRERKPASGSERNRANLRMIPPPC